MIAFDAASNSGYEASLSTYGWTHTTGAGASGLLLVAVGIFATGSVTSITYGSASLTFFRAYSTSGYKVEEWYLLSPASGADTLTVNLSASLTSIGGAVSYLGVDQTNPFFGDAGLGKASGVGVPTNFNITPTADNSWAFSCIATSDTGISAHSGDSERVNSLGVLGSLGMSDIGPIHPATTQNLQWTGLTVPGSNATGGAALQPAGASVTYPQLEREQRGMNRGISTGVTR